ncbi:hypothetical protein QN277_005563 [Acacia crassicarpa]|uniref:Uncharacterized protein n=1 Tax=Acacia crassicarpa TaxID=499986 RepID=A0AAE1MED9_9FABA|nr:hypothetical protein QN277_005563 [Acacia crassicarpa]
MTEPIQTLPQSNFERREIASASSDDIIEHGQQISIQMAKQTENSTHLDSEVTKPSETSLKDLIEPDFQELLGLGWT